MAFGKLAVLIIGAAGSGKSSLALQLISQGATLIADDRTILTVTEYGLNVSCPDAIRNKIEARGVGILNVEGQISGELRLVVDLDKNEPQRLPPVREIVLLGQNVSLLHTPVHSHFPAAIQLYMKGGRHE